MEKFCNGCQTSKPLTEFHKDNTGRRKYGVVTRCKVCRSNRMKAYVALPGVKERRQSQQAEWRNNNKDYLSAREAKRRLEKRAQCLIANARTRAKNRNILFNLDSSHGEIQRRIDAGSCELTGVRFDLAPGRKWNSPSIDRIDPKAGYVLSNIRVICHAMNAAMGDWGEMPVWEMFQSWQAMQSSRRSRKRS